MEGRRTSDRSSGRRNAPQRSGGIFGAPLDPLDDVGSRRRGSRWRESSWMPVGDVTFTSVSLPPMMSSPTKWRPSFPGAARCRRRSRARSRRACAGSTRAADVDVRADVVRARHAVDRAEDLAVEEEHAACRPPSPRAGTPAPSRSLALFGQDVDDRARVLVGAFGA